MKDTGGPAFPIPGLHNDQDFNGMTLRDYFAAKALAGIWSNDGALTRLHKSDKTSKNIAAVCYEMADAMLAERAKQ